MPNRSLDLHPDPLLLLAKAELGSARIPVSEQCQAPAKDSGLRTLHFIKSSNEGEFILSRDSGDGGFLMIVFLDEKSREFRVYHKRPSDPDFVESRPDFKLSWNENGENWSVVMCSEALVCSTCMYRSRNVSYFDEKPAILNIRQGVHHSEKGSQHWFFMDIDGISTEFGDRVVECRRCRTGIDSFSPLNSRSSFISSLNTLPIPKPELHLKSVIPTITKSGDLSIRFLTRGRSILPSARNMQITSNGEVVFQFIRISNTKFNIDFRSPLSPIQALCIALSTHYWK
jgi:hypothetical protein